MNHLPFVLREVLEVPFTPVTTRRTHARIPMSRFGGQEGKMILQDMQVYPFYISNPDNNGSGMTDYRGICHLNIRIGWEGKGYLTEELLPYGIQCNAGTPLVPVWEFLHPYRIDPGQGLQARVVHRAATTAYGGYYQTPGIMFHGKRVKDNLPIMLYDSKHTFVDNDVALGTGLAVILSRSTLNCPADSSVLIYSVGSYVKWRQERYPGPLNTPPPLVQVIDPNGREWVTSNISTPNLLLGVAPAAGNVFTTSDMINGMGWIDNPMNTIELGEKRGWVRENNETMLIELELPTGAVAEMMAYDTGGVADGYNFMCMITIRGCLEVADA